MGKVYSRNMKSFFLIATVLCTFAAGEIVPTESYTHSAELIENEVFHVFWKYDATTITFEVHAKTLGWVGFGLTPNGGMAGSDMTITWIKDGFTYFSDRHALGKYEPVKDASQDWNLLSAEESGQYTIIKLSRKHVTGDLDDLCITESTMRLIYAFSPNDPTSASASAGALPSKSFSIVVNGNFATSNESKLYGNFRTALEKHTVKGTKSVQLLAPQETTEQTLPDDAFSFDFLNTEGTPSGAKDTTYWCQAFKPPVLNGTKHHVVMVEPIIQEGHESLVHHILLYACNSDLPDPHTPDSINGYDGDCFENEEAGMEVLINCQAVLFGWAIGGTQLYFPEHVGMPLGDSKYPTLIRMETHYDNPDLAQNIKDYSGLRIWLSPTLRENDAAFLEVGLDLGPESQLIPPQSNAFFSQGLCHGDCLAEAMTEANHQNIKLFGGFLHSHLAGFGVRVRHIRDGVELPLISEDNNYDFNFQELRLFGEEVTIQGGDHLLTDCAYKTMDRSELTKGGLGTMGEMCLSYLLYYPKIPVTKCHSEPTSQQYAKFLPGEGIQTECQYFPWAPDYCYPIVTEPAELQGQDVHQVLDGISWDTTKTDRFQKVTMEGEIALVCKPTGVQVYETDNKLIDFPAFDAYEDTSIYSTCPSAFELYGTWTSKASATQISFGLLLTTWVMLKMFQ